MSAVWTRTTRAGAWGVLFLALCGPALRAQEAPAGPPKVYTNKPQFRLPLRLAPPERAQLREVQLHVKAGAAPWILKERAAPNRRDFACAVPHDGEYWYTVATVDRDGKVSPADVATATPGLVVVVDTRPPEFQLRVLPGAPGESLVQCKVRDANLEPAKILVECQAGDRVWHRLTALPHNAEVYRVPAGVGPGGLVRVTAMDLAGNVNVGEVALSAPPSAVAQQPPPPPFPPPAPREEVRHASSLPSRSEKVELNPPGEPAQAPAPPALLNRAHASLEYAVEKQGPSGVGKVEVWLTADQGGTWRCLCEDSDRRSPVSVELPGDGIYGLNLVLTNGNGVRAAPPSAGSEADFWVEVDTQKPAAQLLSLRLGTGPDGEALQIQWQASDRNLGPEPVDLYYAARREGPWVPIARGLRNDGLYRWLLPREAGGEFSVRLDVTDRAGNTVRCESPRPVVLDRLQPRGRVLGVAGAAPSVSPLPRE